MNTTQEVHATIASAFAALDVLDNISTTPYLSQLHFKALTGERRHRKGNGGEYKCTASQAAQMFCVRTLTRYASGRSPIPSAAEMLTLRDDFVYAAQIAANYRATILKALAGHDIEWLAGLDYVKLVENRPQ